MATAYLLNAQARVDLETLEATERAALVALRDADRSASEFMATVIHELRTPMTSIRGYTEMLQDEATGELNETQHQLVDAIGRNSDRLAALADDLLTLARLEQGPVLDDHEDVDLGVVVRAAAGALQGLTDRRRLELRSSSPRPR